MTDRKRLLVIINPISGVGRQKTIEKVLAQHLDHSRFDYDIRYTERAGHATDIAREGSAQGYEAVIAVGGDGSINEVAKGLIGTGTTMGIIPCGSGNGMARHMHLPLTPEKAVEVINKYHTEDIDTIDVNGHSYVSIAGVGFDAFVARRLRLTKKRGFAGYARIMFTEYPRYKAKEYRMIIDGKECSHKALMVSVANSSQFGFNAAIAPTASLTDGLLDVCIVEKVPYLELPITAEMLLMSHNFEKSEHVEIIQAKEVTILNNDYRWINYDGEALKLDTELHFKIVPKSLNVICHGEKE